MDFMNVILKRHSVRAYKPEQIGEQNLNTILCAASAAPVGRGEYDKIHLTVVQNPELLQKISDKTAKLLGMPEGANALYGAPTLIVVSEQAGQDHGVACANAGCIIENMLLAATGLGLGSVFLFAFVHALKENSDLVKALQLPDGFEVKAGAAIGYPQEALPIEKKMTVTLKVNTVK